MSVEQKFNTIMPETDDRALCIRIDRPITTDGYEKNFIPRVHEMVSRHGGVRLLLYYNNFVGWEQAAVQRDLEAAVMFRDKLVRFALVDPPEKEAFQKMLKQTFMSGQLRFFSRDQLTDAVRWVRE